MAPDEAKGRREAPAKKRLHKSTQRSLFVVRAVGFLMIEFYAHAPPASCPSLDWLVGHRPEIESFKLQLTHTHFERSDRCIDRLAVQSTQS